MYLFNDNLNRIDIYKFEPIEDMIREYRFEEMVKIPKEDRVYRAVTNSTAFPLDRSNIANKDRIDIEDLNYPKSRIRFNKFYHRIEEYTNFNDYGYYSALDEYCRSGCTYGCLIEVVDGDKTKNFLLPSAHYLKNKDDYEMESIINLPEKLKVLYYLEQGNFEKLKDLDIEEQASLFMLSTKPVLSVFKSDLKLLKDSRLVSNVAPNNEIQNDTNMVKRLQKIYK